MCGLAAAMIWMHKTRKVDDFKVLSYTLYFLLQYAYDDWYLVHFQLQE